MPDKPQVAVTPTAAEYKGIYRNKQQHEPDFDAVLDRAGQSCVKHVLLTGMSLRDVDFILDICKRRPEICTMTVGVHPYHASEPWNEAPNYFGVLKGRIRELIALGPSSPLKAFGELGPGHRGVRTGYRGHPRVMEVGRRVCLRQAIGEEA